MLGHERTTDAHHTRAVGNPLLVATGHRELRNWKATHAFYRCRGNPATYTTKGTRTHRRGEMAPKTLPIHLSAAQTDAAHSALTTPNQNRAQLHIKLDRPAKDLPPYLVPDTKDHTTGGFGRTSRTVDFDRRGLYRVIIGQRIDSVRCMFSPAHETSPPSCDGPPSSDRASCRWRPGWLPSERAGPDALLASGTGHTRLRPVLRVGQRQRIDALTMH